MQCNWGREAPFNAAGCPEVSSPHKCREKGANMAERSQELFSLELDLDYIDYRLDQISADLSPLEQVPYKNLKNELKALRELFRATRKDIENEGR